MKDIVNRISQRWRQIAAGGLLVLIGYACSGATSAPPATQAPANTQAQVSTPAQAATSSQAGVEVTLQSYSVTPSTTTAKAGDVTFNVTNAATDQAHEFVVIQTDLAADKLPVGGDATVDESAVTMVDELPEMDPGKSGTLTVNLASGHYVLICNRPGHYQQGMHSDFTVTP